MTTGLIDKLDRDKIKVQVREIEGRFERVDDNEYILPEGDRVLYVKEDLFRKSEIYFNLFLERAKDLLKNRFEQINLNLSIQPDCEGGIYFNAIKKRGEMGIGYLLSIDLDGTAEYNIHDMDKNKEYKGKLNL